MHCIKRWCSLLLEGISAQFRKLWDHRERDVDWLDDALILFADPDPKVNQEMCEKNSRRYSEEPEDAS